MLLKKMSYTKQGAEFMPNPLWAIVKLYSVKKGVFPWGFRKLVERIFTQWKSYAGEDFRFGLSDGYYEYPSSKIGLKEDIEDCALIEDRTKILRIYQRNAVKKLVAHQGGILCMPTGSGKTITTIEYLKLMQKPTLIIVTTLDIKKMWESKTKHLDYVKVINYQSGHAKEWVKLSDIVVFDECHHAAAKTVYQIAMEAKTEAILIGLSATPKREDGEDMRINGALGDIVFSIGRRELIDAGYLSDATVYYHKPMFNTKDDFTLTYAELYDKHIVKNFDRNMAIIKYASDYVAQGKKVLVLVSQIEHGQFVFEQIQTESKIYCHGSSKDRYKKLEDYDVIVASNIFNEGIDLPELDVIILAAGGKSSIQLTQRIGRGLRPKKDGRKAIIIDFEDSEPKYLKAHYKKRRELLSVDFEVVQL